MPKVALSTLAKERRYSYEGVTYRNRYFLGSQLRDGGQPGVVNEPEAFIVGMPDPGATLRPHFHAVDQFQVVLSGDGMLGKEQFHPVSVHYADAYTPYGPIVAGLHGIRFFVLRAQTDNTGGHFMPEARHQMKGKAGRHAVCAVDVEPAITLYRRDSTTTELIKTHADGLGAFALKAGPGVKAIGPNPKGTGSHYYLVIAGSALHDSKEMPLWSCIFARPEERPLEMMAGPSGVELLVLQFGFEKA